jgi:hypothetical protein
MSRGLKDREQTENKGVGYIKGESLVSITMESSVIVNRALPHYKPLRPSRSKLLLTLGYTPVSSLEGSHRLSVYSSVPRRRPSVSRGPYTPKKDAAGFKFELDVSHAVKPSKIPPSYKKLMLAETSKHQRSRIKPRTSIPGPRIVKKDPSKERAMVRNRIIEKIRSRSLAPNIAPTPHIMTSDTRLEEGHIGLAEAQRRAMTGKSKVLKLEYVLESQDLSIDSEDEESFRLQASSPIKGIYGP